MIFFRIWSAVFLILISHLNNDRVDKVFISDFFILDYKFLTVCQRDPAVITEKKIAISSFEAYRLRMASYEIHCIDKNKKNIKKFKIEPFNWNPWANLKASSL